LKRLIKTQGRGTTLPGLGGSSVYVYGHACPTILLKNRGGGKSTVVKNDHKKRTKRPKDSP